MSGKWERTFDVCVPIERLWAAFRDEHEYGAILAWPEEGGSSPPDPNKHQVVEFEPLTRIRFKQRADVPDPGELTVTFESTETGSRFTVKRDSDGEGEPADVFADSNSLGFGHGFSDLVFYLETGVPAFRHPGESKSCTGMLYQEHDWGIEVLAVNPGSFAENAGLARGDRIIRVGDTPIYTRNDIWGLVAAHEPGTTLSVEYVRDGQRCKGTGQLSHPQLSAVGE